MIMVWQVDNLKMVKWVKRVEINFKRMKQINELKTMSYGLAEWKKERLEESRKTM